MITSSEIMRIAIGINRPVGTWGIAENLAGRL
jgi:hypothetical protein